MNSWLRTFSLLDKLNKWDELGIAKKKKFMQTRIESDSISDVLAVPGLPYNWYENEFCIKLLEYQAECLNMQPFVPISHTSCTEK